MDWDKLTENLRVKPTPGTNSHKLSWKDVNIIREEYQRGYITMAKLAAQFGVNVATISRIVRYVYW